MDEMAGFCRYKVAEYTRRAEETNDKQTRKFLCMMRDNWIAAVKDHQKLADAKAPRRVVTSKMQPLNYRHHDR
jgi:hypothetical protein